MTPARKRFSSTTSMDKSPSRMRVISLMRRICAMHNICQLRKKTSRQLEGGCRLVCSCTVPPVTSEASAAHLAGSCRTMWEAPAIQAPPRPPLFLDAGLDCILRALIEAGEDRIINLLAFDKVDHDAG